MKDKIYYKYRSLKGDNWEYLLDIILNDRLYCAKYNELNDPMEGFYKTRENLPHYVRDYILNQKGEYRICSLAKDDTNKLLWAHYANGFSGIVIGIKTKYLVQNVNYNGLHELGNMLNINNQDIDSIFLHKHIEWAYENESRIISNNPSKFVEIEVVEIVFGQRINQSLKELLIKLFFEKKPNVVLKQQNRNFENELIKNINH